MKNFYSFFFVMIAAIITTNLFSQTNTFPSSGAAGIGTTAPAASSLLEVKSTSKGVLFSRMTKTQRDAITSPATGLLIYQTNATPGLYYYNGTAWKAVTVIDTTLANKTLSNLTSPTAVSASLVPGSDNKYNLGSSLKKWKNMYLYNLNFNDGSLQTTAFIPYTAGAGISITGGVITNTKKTQWSTSGNNIVYNAGDAIINGITLGKGANDSAYNTAVGNGSLFSNTTGNYNTAAGYTALFSNTTGSWNSAFGVNALLSNTTGTSNTANGYYALFANTTGYSNTANGLNALRFNTTGGVNSAFGDQALYYNTTGILNTANGWGALYSNTTGRDNTAVGVKALYDNIGDDNVAVGSEAAEGNMQGSYNTALGVLSLSGTTTSQYNTAVGYKAGDTYDNGYNNVFLGANVDVTGPGFYNVIAIGQGTVCTDVSQVTMGNGATATYRAYANWTNISDGRFKKNMKENVPGLEFINKLKPITYTLDATGIDNFLHKDLPQNKQIDEKVKAVMNKALAEKEKVVYTGFVAQDVEKAAKSLNYDFSGVDAAKNNKDLYGLRYAEFVVPLVKGMQELSKMNDEKDAKINDLETRLAKLESIMNVSQSTTNLPAGQAGNKLQTTTISASLAQNIPNPFQNSTTINYSLPQQFSSAQIIITDKSGKVLKQIAVSGNGKGSVQVNTSTLSSGAYQYSLHVDGRIIDTKQMERLK